jgi:hypothetical protein
LTFEGTLRRNRKALIVITALLIVVVSSASFTLNANLSMIQVPGWEIYNQIAGITYSDSTKVLTKASDFTSPNFISAVQWKVDNDDSNSGYPTIQIEIGDIQHVNFMGQPIPNSQSAQSFTKTVGNHTYQLDDHVYMFTVTIRTVADCVDKGVIPPYMGQNWANGYHYWTHETSWASVACPSVLGATQDVSPQAAAAVGLQANIGKQFNGVVYPKFVINPWSQTGDTTPTPDGYKVYNAWAGVMNAYVYQRNVGQVENQWGTRPEPDVLAPIFFKAGIDPGNQVPMFKDDGSFGTISPVVTWDNTMSPTTRSASTVVLGLPAQLQAGAKLTRDGWNGVIAVTPCDAYVMYTVRVDVLQTHDFLLQTAIEPPTPTPPSDYYSWYKSFWEGVAASGWWYIIFIALVLLAALWIVLKTRRAR